MSTTRPAFQFYPGDWLRDTALRSCSPAARGLWIDMLCFMHNGEPRGLLKVKGKVISEDNLARMVGVNLVECRRLVKELEKAGVFDRGPGAVIINRRMVRDAETQRKRVEGGRKGGNPQLLKERATPHEDNLPVNRVVKGKVTAKDNPEQQQRLTTPADAAAEVVVVDVERGVQGGETPPHALDYATRCCLMVNRVLSAQLAGAFTSLVANVERPTAKAWEAAGIPIELAERVLAEHTGRFPNGRSRQPQSLGYFTAALHEALAKSHAAGGAAPLKDYERMRLAAEAERAKERVVP